MRTVIIGGGHNALVAAWYLADAGHEVDLFERSATLGGACSTRNFECGCYINDGANAYGMLDPAIRLRLNEVLGERNYQASLATPAIVLPTHEGSLLSIYSDNMIATADIINDQTADSGAHVQDLFGFLSDATQSVASLWTDPHARTEDFHTRLSQVHRDAPEIFLSGSLNGMLSRFVSDSRTLAATAAGNLLLPRSPSAAGTAFPTLYLGLSEVDGTPGWGVVHHGIARVTDALAEAASIAGARLHVAQEVSAITGKNGNASGIRIGSDLIPADMVISGADPITTFFNLLPPSLRLDEVFEYRLRTTNYDGACAKINALLRKPIHRQILPGGDTLETDPSQIVICPDIEYLELAYQDYQRGLPSSQPYVEITSAYALDKSASCGEHFPISLYILFCPYRSRVSEAERDALYQAALNAVAKFIPSLSESDVYWHETLMPADIESRYGMFRGNVDHGPMTPENRLEQRPFSSDPTGATPINNLFLCGAGIHPGGLVSGRAGHNAANVILGRT